VTSPSPNASLVAALEESRRAGALGRRPVEATIAHAESFVAALEGVTGTVLDLGSGGGVPGLVIAFARPDLRVVLLDRREKRTDLCRRLVRRLGLDDRVQVITADASDTRALAGVIPVDAVVARGFGPPMTTAATAARLLRAGGVLIVSEPPTGNRWDDEELTGLGLTRVRWSLVAGRVVVMRRVTYRSADRGRSRAAAVRSGPSSPDTDGGRGRRALD
jgi:16S rRNA (guanine527-N7)-methyltransferase